MAISINPTIKKGDSIVTEIVSGGRVYNMYTVTGSELTNAGAGVKLTSGAYEVPQTWYGIGNAGQDHFVPVEKSAGVTIPLTSPNHTVSLTAYDNTGDGNSVSLTLIRDRTTVIDVVAASAQLTAPSIFATFVSMGVTITDGQQLQYENVDDSGNAISYANTGIGTFPAGIRSRHRVCLWDAGTLYETYVEVDDDGLAADPAISVSLTEQSSSPTYDGRSPSALRPAANRPFGADLWNINELTFVGACRIPYGTYNNGSIQFNSNCYFHFDNARNSIFVAGSQVSPQAGSLMVGEFSLPAFVASTDYSALNVATNSQPFFDVFSGSDESVGFPYLDRITGIYSNGADSELIVNAINWYDNLNRPETTVVINDKTNIAASSIDGLYDLSGGRSAAGWMGAIPAADQAAFGCAHFYGYAANDSIDGSLSIGPSLRGLDLTDLTANPSLNGAITDQGVFMNYPYDPTGATHIMGVDHATITNAVYNKTTTIRSMAFLPSTDTIMCVGKNDGLRWGEQYKIANDAGDPLSGGDSPFVKSDRHNYYWLFKKSDVLAAANPWDVEPYDFGVLKLPFMEVVDADYVPDGYSMMIGASFDPIGGHWYFLLDRKNGAADNGAADRVLVKYGV
jgi:hypothetical protein